MSKEPREASSGLYCHNKSKRKGKSKRSDGSQWRKPSLKYATSHCG